MTNTDERRGKSGVGDNLASLRRAWRSMYAPLPSLSQSPHRFREGDDRKPAATSTRRPRNG
jgi:hypothetical protein